MNYLTYLLVIIGGIILGTLYGLLLFVSWVVALFIALIHEGMNLIDKTKTKKSV